MVRELIMEELEEMLCTTDIEDDMNLFDDLALSSLEVFDLFSTLEEKLDITVNEDAISDIATVGDFIETIEKLCNN